MSQTTEVLEVSAPKIKNITRVSIRPYIPVDGIRDTKMGLDEEGQALFPGTYQIDRIGLEERNGYKTYFTGLNENTPEIQLLPDEKKLPLIREIRETVAYLENTVGKNFQVRKETCMEGYGTKDDKFWANVKTFNSTGPDTFDQKGLRVPTYFDKVELTLNNDITELNLSEPHDLVSYYAIKAGGLSMVAPSLKVAMESGAYNFYLDIPEEVGAIKVESKMRRNKVGSYIDAMNENNHTKLFYMCKLLTVLDPLQYKRGGPNFTPNEYMYSDLCDYIDGKRGDEGKLAIEKFMEFYEMSDDELLRRVVIRDGLQLSIIDHKDDSVMWYKKKNVTLGRTIEDASVILKSASASAAWIALKEEVMTHWAQ